MNSQMALKAFDSALSIMARAATLQARADTLTAANSAFSTFELLLTAIDYRPSLSRRDPDTRELGVLYDAAQQARGDDRRAFMYGSPARKGSIIDRRNWDAAQCWYRVGQRIAWWDRCTRQWIVYTLDLQDYQEGAADFYRNATDLLRNEECHE